MRLRCLVGRLVADGTHGGQSSMGRREEACGNAGRLVLALGFVGWNYVTGVG